MNVQSLSNKCFLILILIALGCTGKKEDNHDHGSRSALDESVWEPMDNFHMVMAETFHPYKDSANLEPVKTQAAELVTLANAWVQAPLPEKMDNDEVKSNLQKLQQQATGLAESVKVADENVIGDRLSQLHDTFHELQEAWYGEHH